MTLWTIKHGDILDEPADVLVCSANVFLNLSGGVGGAILLRYGEATQKELHGILAKRQRRFVDQGEVVQTSPCGSPHKAVLHAVAVDGLYHSSPQVIRSVVAESLSMAASLGAHRVSLTALATGYGKLTMGQFAEGIIPLMSMEFAPIEEVVICVRNSFDRDELVAAFPRPTRDRLNDLSAGKSLPVTDAVLILEDDQSRIDRFVSVLKAIHPTSQIICWRSARKMIQEMDRYLPAAHLISLDHDLNPVAGDSEDPGDGLEVAKYLAEREPPCPIIIHSSNGDRARMMAGEFELAGCPFKVVAPLGEDWIEAYWAKVVRSLLALKV